jgi:antitoxin ParD1/3/4
MNVSLTPQLEEMIRQKVDTGRYNNASEVVRDALRLLETRDERESWLRARMATAEDQVRRGDVVEDTGDFWEALDRDVDDRLARGDSPSPNVRP